MKLVRGVAVVLSAIAASAAALDVQLLGSLTLDEAEIVAYEPVLSTAFVVGGGKMLSIVDLTDPSNPTLSQTIEMDNNSQSVACNKDGLVAVATTVMATTSSGSTYHDAGKVLFFKKTGATYTQVGEVGVGVLPDSIAFNQDGTVLVTANEGEPNKFYGNIPEGVDPRGSVSIINVNAAAPSSSTVTTLTFEDYNDQLTHLKQRGLHFVGEESETLVEYDLEPEYVAITGNVAYITAQEQNAIITVDLTTKSILDIYCAGIKDWDRGTAAASNYQVPTLPYPGTRPDENGNGQIDNNEVTAGGLSGLFWAGNDGTQDILYTISDRGPQAYNVGDDARPANAGDEAFGEKVFDDPDYPITVYKLGFASGAVTYLGHTVLNVPASASTFRPSTGIGYLSTHDKAYQSNGNKSFTALPRDPFGLDSESILITTVAGMNGGDDVFVVVDEYGPQVGIFDVATGNLVKRYIAEGTPAQADPTFYIKTSLTLPSVLLERHANRGFEAAALNSEDGLLYCFVQSPMRPSGVKAANTLRRVFAIDLATGVAAAEYVYLQAGPASQDKIGDAVYDASRGTFLVVDRDSSTKRNGNKAVMEFDFRDASNVLDYDWSWTGAEFPELAAAGVLDTGLRTKGIKLVKQYEIFNLPSIGGDARFDKPEGIALAADGSVFVNYDNDFTRMAGRPDNMITKVDFTALDVDTSDKDAGIVPGYREFYGSRQPDAIATYTYMGETFMVLANEGDSRVRPDDVNFVSDQPDGTYMKITSDAAVAAATTTYGTFTDELTGLQCFVISAEDTDPGAEEVDEGDEFYLTDRFGFSADDDYFSNEKRTEKISDLSTYSTFVQTQGKKNKLMGRLKVIPDASSRKLIGFGGRGMSILDSQGNTVYDSGSITEQAAIAAGIYDDNRSDDKGTEPESVTIYTTFEGGSVKNYAIVGLERVSALCIFDVTDPYAVEFKQLVDVKADSTFESPEGLVAKSGLLLVSNEVTRGLAVYSLPFAETPEPTPQPTAQPTLQPTPQPSASSNNALWFWILLRNFFNF